MSERSEVSVKDIENSSEAVVSDDYSTDTAVSFFMLIFIMLRSGKN